MFTNNESTINGKVRYTLKYSVIGNQLSDTLAGNSLNKSNKCFRQTACDNLQEQGDAFQ